MKRFAKPLFICISFSVFIMGIIFLSSGIVPDFIQQASLSQLQIWDLSLILICVISFFFHLLYNYYVPKKTSHLYFGLLSGSIAISLLFHGSCLIQLIFPNLALDWFYRIFLLSYALRIVSLLLYLESIFAKEVLHMVFRFLLILTLTLVIVVFLSPLYLLQYLLTTFCIISLFSALFSLYVSAKGYYVDYIGAPYYVIAFLLLTLGSYSDLLYHLSLTQLPSMLFISQILFVILQTFLQAKQHYRAIRNTRALTEKINTTLAETQDNRSTFISSHIKPAFLSETLLVISNTCETDPAHADTLILALATYLRQMLDFDGKNKVYSLTKELELIDAYKTIVAEHNPELSMEYQIADDIPDIDLPPLSIHALLDNAVFHAFPDKKEGQRIVLSITRGPSSLTVAVSDNGIGMSEQDISYAFDFPNRNLNVGLYDINLAIQTMYKTSLSILSRLESGTVISFTLPLRKEVSYE